MSRLVISVQVSQAAKQHIQRILTDQSVGDVLRLSIVKYGCSGYGFKPEIVSQVPQSDAQAHLADDLIIYIEKKYAKLIENTRIELVEKSLGQKQLSFVNERLNGACGCGESFELPKDFIVKEDAE